MKNPRIPQRAATLLAALCLTTAAFAEEWHGEGRDEARTYNSPDFLDLDHLGKVTANSTNIVTAIPPILSSGRLIKIMSDSASSDIISNEDLNTGAQQFSARVGGNNNPTVVHQLLAADDFVVAVANSVATGNGFLRFVKATTLNGTKTLSLNAPVKNAILHRHSVSQKLYLVCQVGSTEIRGFEITALGFVQKWSQAIPSSAVVTRPAIVKDKAVFAFALTGFPNNTLAGRSFEVETGAGGLFDSTTSLLLDGGALGVAVDPKRNFVYLHSNRRIRAYSFGGATPSLLWNKPYPTANRRGSLAIATNGLVYTQTSTNLEEIDPLSAGTTTRSNSLGAPTGGLGPVITDDLIWVASFNNRLVAQDLATLTSQKIIAPAPGVLGNYVGVVAVTESNLIALSDLGFERFTHALPVDLVQLSGPAFVATQTAAELSTLFSQGFSDFGTLGGVYPTNTGGVVPTPNTALFRLRNLATGDRLYTTSATERNTALQNGFVGELDAGFVLSADGRGRKPLHRLFNATTGFHALSGNSDFVNDSAFAGFTDEGTIGFVRTQQPTRLQRIQTGGGDLVTLSQKEAADAVATGGQNLGTIGRLFASRDDSPELTPLFRLRNLNTGDRLFTSSPSEKASALALGTFADEGIEGYVHTRSGAGRIPLLRAFDSSTGRHRYTTDPIEFQGFSGTIVREGTIGFIQK